MFAQLITRGINKLALSGLRNLKLLFMFVVNRYRIPLKCQSIHTATVTSHFEKVYYKWMNI